MYRRSPLRQNLAAVTAALLLTDAWFDVVTASSGGELWLASGLAVLGGIALAVLCFLLARTPR